MNGVEELRAAGARRAALMACALAAIGVPLDLLIGRRVAAMPVWPALLAGAVGLALTVGLSLSRNRTSVRASELAFLVNAATLTGCLWRSNTAYLEVFGPAFHYDASKLAVLGVAMLAPAIGVGVASVLLLAGSAVIHAMVLGPSHGQSLLVEPWAAAVYGGIAVALLVYGHRRRTLEWDMVQARAEAAALERFTQALIAIRDLANTPLQTLTLGFALIARTGTVPSHTLARMERSLARLHELQVLLAVYGPRRAAHSFDARDVLRENGVKQPAHCRH